MGRIQKQWKELIEGRSTVMTEQVLVLFSRTPMEQLIDLKIKQSGWSYDGAKKWADHLIATIRLNWQKPHLMMDYTDGEVAAYVVAAIRCSGLSWNGEIELFRS